MKVAIQGIKASFHDVASKMYFQSPYELIECSSFPRLFNALINKEADYAVMAIENALAGSILPNYALMEKHQIKILGEVFLKIKMSLLALPSERIEDIQVVQTHPMALLQCQNYLSKLKNVKLVEHADTAESASDIKKFNLVHHAAIASDLAAETYGLQILKDGIEDNKLNFTRFLVLSRSDDYKRHPHSNKATLCFEAEDKPGSLVKTLNIFEKLNINMTKIQSLPVVGKPYHYAFHVDLEWEDEDQYQIAMEELKTASSSLTHFGEYPAGRRPEL